MTSSNTATEVSPAPPAQPENERKFVLIISAIFALVLILPYLWVWAVEPIGYVWGGLIGETFDSNVHLAWARQSQDGALFFRDLFTTESFVSGEKPLFFNALPWVWGKLALTGIPLIFWFHLTRVGAGIWTLWEFHKLCRRVLPQVSERQTALYVIAFTTGGSFLGLLIPYLGSAITFIDHPSPANSFPTMPEAFMFTSAFLFPLNILAYGLMTFLFRKVLESEEKFGARDAFAVFAGSLLLANIHTYDAIPVGLTLGLWMVYSLVSRRFRTAGACLAVLVGVAIPTLRQAIVFRDSAEFHIKALTPTPAPGWLHIAFSLAPLLVFGLAGITFLRRNRFAWLMLTWAVATLLCIYAPVSFARKMIEGGQLPLAVLSGAGLIVLVNKIPAAYRRYGLLGILGLMTLSPLNYLIWDLQNAAENNNSRALTVFMPRQYLLQSEWDALRYLNRMPDKSVAVLSLPLIGAYGPRETGMTFYLSHWAETLYYGEKLGQTGKFYTGRMSPSEASKFLRANRIRYVLETPDEWNLADGSGYAQSYGLVPVWRERTVIPHDSTYTWTTIYTVPQ